MSNVFAGVLVGLAVFFWPFSAYLLNCRRLHGISKILATLDVIAAPIAVLLTASQV